MFHPSICQAELGNKLVSYKKKILNEKYIFKVKKFCIWLRKYFFSTEAVTQSHLNVLNFSFSLSCFVMFIVPEK